MLFAAWFVLKLVFDERISRQSAKRVDKRSVPRMPVWMEKGICVLCGRCVGVCGCGKASEVVVKELAKRAEEAPMERTLLEIRRFIRLTGEGVLLECRDVFC